MKKIIYAFGISSLIFCFQSSAWSENFTLNRVTVMSVNQGQTLDTSRGDIKVTGTMTIDGTTVKQNIETCNTAQPPVCNTAEVATEIMSVDVNNSAVSLMQPDGSVSEIILLSLDPVITMMSVGNLVEVDQWVQTDALSSTSNQTLESEENPSITEFGENGNLGATVINAIHSLELIPSP